MVTVAKQTSPSVIIKMWPENDVLSDSIPERAGDLLKQAMESIHTPSGARACRGCGGNRASREVHSQCCTAETSRSIQSTFLRFSLSLTAIFASVGATPGQR
jgi:hypothetical protein